MYFEPSKKTYYRFPSTKSIIELDNRMYFPEKPQYATDDLRHDHLYSVYMPEPEHYYDSK